MLDIQRVLEFYKKASDIGCENGLSLQAITEFNGEELIFKNKEINYDDVAQFLYMYNLKNKKWTLNIDGEASWEGGQFDIDHEINTQLMSDIFRLVKDYNL